MSYLLEVVPAVILSVVAFIAGHPTQVVCDATLGGLSASPNEIARTPYGGNVIYALPRICDELVAPVGTEAFAHAIGTVIHEASHARGLRIESCAEMTADIGVFDVLRRFYGVSFFSAMSVRVGDQVLAFTHARASNYQPEACWLRGSPA